jgi:cytochrome b561
MDPKAYLGEWFHEWAGLIIALFFVLHKILNWNWISDTSKRLFGKVPGKVRLNYILNVLLLLSFIFIIWSGMEISKTIDFSWLGIERGGQNMIWKSLHGSLSALVIIILGIHVGLHWDWVMARFKRSK